MALKPTGASFATPSVPRKSRSPSACTLPLFTLTPMAVATAPSVTPAHATSASSSMSPEHALRPLPPLAGCSPAAMSALPVCTLHVMPSPSVPSALSVITAASGVSRYFVFSGACSSLSCSVSMQKSYSCRGGSKPDHRLDLHLHPGNRELAHADQRARGAGGAEELLAHRIDLAAVVHVEEIDRHLQDVREARPRGVEHQLHVLENLPRLRRDIVAADQRALCIGRRHAGDEQQLAEAHRVAVMADRRRQAVDHQLLFAHFLSFALAFAAGFSVGQ